MHIVAYAILSVYLYTLYLTVLKNKDAIENVLNIN
jgi:hypothetical protein